MGSFDMLAKSTSRCRAAIPAACTSPRIQDAYARIGHPLASVADLEKAFYGGLPAGDLARPSGDQ